MKRFRVFHATIHGDAWESGLLRMVEDALNDGWEMVGGTTYDGHSRKFTQAMVKDEPEPPHGQAD